MGLPLSLSLTFRVGVGLATCSCQGCVDPGEPQLFATGKSPCEKPRILCGSKHACSLYNKAKALSIITSTVVLELIVIHRLCSLHAVFNVGLLVCKIMFPVQLRCVCLYENGKNKEKKQ